MKVDEKIVRRLEELILKGEHVLKTKFSRSGGGITNFWRRWHKFRISK